ncbi:YeeE/YedE family protein [Paracoccus sp. P2]|uniref:YeeE/YedE family protein n=1 Tax=Paracoccus pantotrophus TaxID=82367 RepID=A0A7H9BQX5_PARPN|nr:YeeE/YedE family protein [Paracoccus pantotrophus]MDF3855141.1 YeeE/YedE family protein [Paracoccus pantotrophus]QLH13479.1 YeeE/YedE family protein [Paracoccus pantotrophus]RDD95804.1 YeeE/YedE family protein [Paracoccus pantotrophus]RNI16958.1 YeeE/YedE family protein [Paracoccus pantotrophus]WGR67305.1 YeeE/YedE family protein [Paracoccus pantotrophus]
MDLDLLLEHVPEPQLAAIFGLLVGAVFGFSAERSSFCLRAATVEFARGSLGPKVAVWLLTFSTAVIWVQGAGLLGLFRTEQARMMAVTGSWSGAMIGGLMFGAGMVLARGCSGRLLVLAATGNLRSLVSGLIFAVVAQMALHGWLAPLRQELAGLWTTPGGRNVSLLMALPLRESGAILVGIGFAVLALWLARANRIGLPVLIFASGVGFAVALGWVLTFSLSQQAFEPVSVTSATFSGPSASTLMFFLTESPVLDFDIGLVPGVFAGAFLSAALKRRLKFQGFEGEGQMRRSMLGAALMGFGAMLAGGCAIGAGVSGGSIFVATAWLALLCMWIGAVITDWLVDQSAHRATA